MFKWLTLVILFALSACNKNPVVPYTPKTYPTYSNPFIYQVTGYRLFALNGEINDQAIVKNYASEFQQYFYTPASTFNDIKIKKIAFVTADSIWNLGTNPIGDMKKTSTGEYDTYESEQWFPGNDTNSIVMHLMKYKIFEKRQSQGLWYLKIPSSYNIFKRSGDTLFFPVTKFILISRNSYSVGFSSDQFNNDFDLSAYKRLGANDTLLLQKLDVALVKDK